MSALSTALNGPRRVFVAAVVGLLAITTIGGLISMHGDKNPIVYADFSDASPLIVGNDVKVAGVTVGKVESIEVHDGDARVGMSLEKDALPLYADAHATVRPASLLGERYIEIDRGNSDKPRLAQGAILSTAHTGNSVDLDQVLNSLDEPTSQALAAFLTTVGDGLNDRGPSAAAAIKALQPAMTQTGELARVLDQQSGVLAQLITDLQPLTSSVASRKGADLDNMLSAADSVLQATSAKQSQLDATLAQLPGTLGQGRKTLGLLTRAAKSTTPTLAGMRPTTDVLTGLARELSRFSAAGKPALQALQPTLERARALLAAAAPVAKSLRRSSPGMVRTVHGLKPVGVTLLGDLGHVLDFVKFWALTTNNADGLSNYFRSLQVATAEPVTGLLSGGTPGALSGLLGGSSSPTAHGGLSGLTGLLGGLLSGKNATSSSGTRNGSSSGGGLVGNLLGGLGLRTVPQDRTASRPASGSVTGLSAHQETAMVQYLVGGSR